MSVYYDFDKTNAFTTGAIGEPGQRTFLLQIRADGHRVTLKCEKQQIAAMSQFLRQLLADAPDVEDRPLDDAMQIATPLEVEFILGTVGLAYDQRNDRMVLQLDEMAPTDENGEADPEFEVGRVRAFITRGQASAFCEHADDVVAAGRPLCVFCGQPINIDGHMCPRMN